MAACGDNRILIGDCIEQMATLEAGSVQTCVTSPPFWGLRDYGHPGQIGLEASPSQYVEKLVAVFRSVRRLLRDDGTLWLNLGDTYAGYHGNSRVPDDQAPSNKPGYVENMRTSCVGVEGLKAKDLVGIPWSVAFALRADGWYLRSEVVWQKTNPMPETARDRPARSHEQVFLLSKRPRYHYDPPPAARRTVWTLPVGRGHGGHRAVFPPDLIRPMILASCPPGGLVLDLFMGSGTTAQVAQEEGRRWVGVELNREYVPLITGRTASTVEAG